MRGERLQGRFLHTLYSCLALTPFQLAVCTYIPLCINSVALQALLEPSVAPLTALKLPVYMSMC